MDPRPTRVFLLRHAETEWNAAQTFQGHLDSPLTAAGLRQAEQLAARLASEGVEAIYSSDQGRSLRTAEIVGSSLGLPVTPRPELREIDCGDWTGRTYQDVRTRWPEQFANWKTRPHLHRMPGGESVAQVQRRGLRFLEEIRDRHRGHTLCAVTHHTVVRVILCHLQGWPLSRLWEGARQLNCAVNLVQFQGDEVDLVEIGNTNHLTTLSTDGISV